VDRAIASRFLSNPTIPVDKMWIKVRCRIIMLIRNDFYSSIQLTKKLVNPEIGRKLKSWKQGRSKEGSKAIEEEKRL
jgi:hypothetical protein